MKKFFLFSLFVLFMLTSCSSNIDGKYTLSDGNPYWIGSFLIIRGNIATVHQHSSANIGLQDIDIPGSCEKKGNVIFFLDPEGKKVPFEIVNSKILKCESFPYVGTYKKYK